MVPIAYAALTSSGTKVTVKSVRNYIFDKTGVRASPNLINEELGIIRSGGPASKGSSESPLSLVRSPFISSEADQKTPEALGDPEERVDYRTLYQEIQVQYAAGQEILSIYQREIAALRDTVKKQSESLARLNTYFAEQIREMAKDASASMLQTVQELHLQISEMQVARESDQEQWKGLRAFLMSETDRIRETETAKTQMLSRKIADLEMMVTHLTQLKNQAQDEASRLKMQIADKNPN